MNFSKFATEKWYVIDSESNGRYLHHDKVFNKVNRIKPLWLFWRIYFSYRKFANAGDNPIQRNQPFAPATQVAFVHHSKIVEQKSIILLLMKQILSILQCLCTIWLKIVTIILIFQEIYGVLKEIR